MAFPSGEGFQVPGPFSPAFSFPETMMSDLSLFHDESGSNNLRDVYYVLALVVHDQSDALDDNISKYLTSLRKKGLPDIPFHANPLLNGRDAYEGLDMGTRKRLLSSFRVFFRHLPIRYEWIRTQNISHGIGHRLPPLPSSGLYLYGGTHGAQVSGQGRHSY